MSLLSVKQETLPTGDKVNLITRVGLLWIVTDGRVKLNHE